MHGYQLKRALSPAVSSSQLLNDGVLYPLLKKMEREELISKRVESSGNAPARNVFRPTKKGRDAFKDWLRSPQSEEDEVTYDFLLGHPFLAKCLFFDQLKPTEVRAKLEAQLVSSASKLKEFERIRAGMAERGVNEYRLAVIDLGIAQQREKLKWLNATIGTLAGQRAVRKAAARTGGARKARKAA
jgi:DNA-binding PadR family transcriptional regulator